MVRFRKILCPVDFFPASLRAFDYALALAAQYGARVHALHVVGLVISAGYETPFSSADLTADLEKESLRLLQKLKEKAVKAEIPIETEVRIGSMGGGIDADILQAVEAKGADLVVMGTHGRRGFKRWILGSVMDQMMRHCPVPLLTTGSTRTTRSVPPRIRRILVTTDFSADAPDALAYAFSMARTCAARITLLHVVHDFSSEVGAEFTDKQVASARDLLDKLVPPDVRTWCDVRTRVKVGTPYQVIQETIESEKPGLVVMNIHGKGMIERVVLGSTAERVLRAASDKCAVLLIPPARAKGQIRVAKPG